MQFDRSLYWDKFDAYISNDGKWYPTREGVYDMFIAGWVGGEHAYGYLDPLFRSTSNSNSAFYASKEVDSLLEEVTVTVDQQKQDDIVRKLQAVIVKDAPWIFAYHSRIIYGLNPRVRGWWTNPAGEYEFQNVSLAGASAGGSA